MGKEEASPSVGISGQGLYCSASILRQAAKLLNDEVVFGKPEGNS